METPSFLQSKNTRVVLATVGVLIVLMAVFQLGIFVGFHKASFAFRWGDNYHRNFGGPAGGFLREFEGRDFINGHGTAGTIASIDGQTIVIKDRDNAEKIVRIQTDTTITKGRETVDISALKTDMDVVVIGSPQDDGSIDAKLIRIFEMGQPPLPPLF